jgi:hypothetical protein
MMHELESLKQALGAAKEYANLIVKPPLEQLGGLLEDTVGYWRLKNKVNLLLKAKQHCEERGVQPEKMLPNVFVRLLEAGADTDDAQLSEMFARLLATHLDPASQSDVHPSFAKVLGQLGPLDVKILKLIDEREKLQWQSPKSPTRDQFPKLGRMPLLEECKKQLNDIPAGQIRLSLDNLERLGICEDDAFIYAAAGLNGSIGISITKFGSFLLCACEGTEYWRRRLQKSDEKAYELWIESNETLARIRRSEKERSDEHRRTVLHL